MGRRNRECASNGDHEENDRGIDLPIRNRFERRHLSSTLSHESNHRGIIRSQQLTSMIMGDQLLLRSHGTKATRATSPRGQQHDAQDRTCDPGNGEVQPQPTSDSDQDESRLKSRGNRIQNERNTATIKDRSPCSIEASMEPF